MKSSRTLKGFFARREGWILMLILFAIMFVGCYEFFSIDQPTEAYSNSSFDVHIVVKEDAGGNDWTVSDLQNIGLFGVLLPDEWTVEDSILFSIISDSAKYNNTGYLKYNASISEMLEDTVGSPENYSWWGSKTTEEADMSYFDSLYFTVTINTDDQTGTFSLQYSVGDQDYWDRNPSDAISDPISIRITEYINATTSIIDESEFRIFPNPTSDKVFVELNSDKFTNAQLNAFDVSGKLMKSINLSDSRNYIDVSSFAKGTYILKLNSDQGSVSTRILVE